MAIVRARSCDDCQKTPVVSKCPGCGGRYCQECTDIMERICVYCAPSLEDILPERPERKLNKREREMRDALIRAYKPAIERWLKESRSLYTEFYNKEVKKNA